MAIIVRVRPTFEEEEWLAEQYDAEGQPIPGTEAARLAEGLMSPAEGMSRSQSQSGIEEAAEDSASAAPNTLSDSEAIVGGSHISVAPISSSTAGLGESFTSSLFPREGEGSTATIDPQASLSLGGSTESALRSSSGGESASKSNIAGSASASSKSHTRDQSTASAASGFSAAGATQIPSLTPIERFFQLPWVQRGTPEILYIKRASRVGDNWSAHVAFPGGRQEDGDENGLYTAMRETWEEVGIDLAEREFLSVGQLDDREITTSLGKRLLMVLSPFGEWLPPPRMGSLLILCRSSIRSSISLFTTPRPPTNGGRIGALDTTLPPLYPISELGHHLGRHCQPACTQVTSSALGPANFSWENGLQVHTAAERSCC